jgi:hypothetical protein
VAHQRVRDPLYPAVMIRPSRRAWQSWFRAGGGMTDREYDTDLALWADNQARALREAGC